MQMRRILIITLLVIAPMSAHALTLKERVALRKGERMTIEHRTKSSMITGLRRRTERTEQAISELERLRQAIIDLTNAERAKADLPPLVENSHLHVSAQRHAEDMHAKSYFSHTSQDGRTIKERIESAGYLEDVSFRTCRCQGWNYTLGENLAMGQDTAEQAVRDWMNSPGHRDNIMNKNYKEIGVGFFGDIWVQNFGSIEYR